MRRPASGQDIQAALDTALSSGPVDPRDAGLATELSYSYLRMRGRSTTCSSGSSRTPGKLPPKMLLAMGMAAYEILFLDKVPAYASVDWAVEFAKTKPGARLAGPFNVMLAEDEGGTGRVKLIDFGLSKLRGEKTPGPKGMVVGSPYYTTPEQEADPESADGRSDGFSVAVTLYRMLTGLLPAEDPAERRTVCELHPDLGCEWDDFFKRGLAPDPADRFPDAVAMIDALDVLEAGWREHRDAACSGADLLAEPELRDGTTSLRAEPRKVPLSRAREAFSLDELWRPKSYARGQFTDNGDNTVTDRAASLTWEKYGSRYPLTWDRAGAHVERLNRNGYGGRTDWRLPTIDELATLFTGSTEPGDFCQQPVFDPRKARLWSADTKAFTAAWYADAQLGFVWWQDRTCRFFARAVCAG